METGILKIMATIIVMASTFYRDYKKELYFKDSIYYIGIILFIYTNLYISNNDIFYFLVSIIYFIAIVVYKKKGNRNKE